MIRFRWWVWLAGCFISAIVLSGWGVAATLPPSPEPHYVQDQSGWLVADAFTSLDLKLEQFERDTSNQVVVAIYPQLPQGEELFDYSQRLFNAWKIGQTGKNNGVLLLVFDADRKIRIHTGYGAEGALPDARANQIIRNVIAPRIQAGDKEAAINGGADAIMASLKGEYVGDGKTNLDEEGKTGGSAWPLVFLLGFVLLGFRFPVLFQVVEVIFSAMGSSSSRGGGSSWGGGGSSSSGGGFSGGGGRSGGGGASGGW